MIRALLARLRQGHHTNAYPEQLPAVPDRFRGRPTLPAAACPPGCELCAASCPTGAIRLGEDGGLASLDLGACLFCTACSDACPSASITFTPEARLAVSQRDDLHLEPGQPYRLASAVGAELRRLYGRSLRLRVVSAGGCNGCEVDVAVLQTLAWDLGRFGIGFVASPRHADGLLLCGGVTTAMTEALRKTWEAIPDPRVCIAVGACAISGGPYAGHGEQNDGMLAGIPVDCYIPGCPPHPLSILDGLLRLIGRMQQDGPR